MPKHTLMEVGIWRKIDGAWLSYRIRRSDWNNCATEIVVGALDPTSSEGNNPAEASK